MNDTLKRLLVMTVAGAIAGLGAASNVDRSEFKRWLQRENLGSIWQNIQEFKWDVAARRWWAGALGGAVTGFLGAIGVEQLGIDLGGLLQLGA